MSGYDPSVTSEAFSDPGTILSLLGAAMPNITRGQPGQGGYTLKPGQFISTLGDTYSTIKNRKESLGAMQDYAKDASQGTQLAPFGGQDPEGVAWAGGGSPTEQAKNLAAYSSPSFGQYLAKQSPDRMRAIFAGARSSNQLDQALGTGQTPFERIFHTIETGEQAKLAQAKQQTLANLRTNWIKDPTNQELNSAIMSLTPPAQHEALAKEQRDLLSSIDYMTNVGTHGPANALSVEKAQAIAGTPLGLSKMQELRSLEVSRRQAEDQRRIIAGLPMDASEKETMYKLLDSGLPLPNFDKISMDAASRSALSSAFVRNPLLQTVYNADVKPLANATFQKILQDPEIQKNPEVMMTLLKMQEAKNEKWAQRDLEERKLAESAAYRKEAHESTLAARYSANMTNIAAKEQSAFNAQQRIRELIPFNAKAETPEQYEAKLMQNKSYAGQQAIMKELAENRRQEQIQFDLNTNPSKLIYSDSVGIPRKIQSVTDDPSIPSDVKLKWLDGVEQSMPKQEAEYGNKIKGWREATFPAVSTAVAEARKKLQAAEGPSYYTAAPEGAPAPSAAPAAPPSGGFLKSLVGNDLLAPLRGAMQQRGDLLRAGPTAPPQAQDFTQQGNRFTPPAVQRATPPTTAAQSGVKPPGVSFKEFRDTLLKSGMPEEQILQKWGELNRDPGKYPTDVPVRPLTPMMMMR